MRKLFNLCTVLLMTAVHTGCSTHYSTRIAKTHTAMQEIENGVTSDKGYHVSESITCNEGPKISRPWFQLINLTFFPLWTMTGPAGDAFDAKQKKNVSYYSSDDKLQRTIDMEAKVYFRLGRPMLIAQHCNASAYIADVFDYIWKRANRDMYALKKRAVLDESLLACTPSFEFDSSLRDYSRLGENFDSFVTTPDVTRSTISQQTYATSSTATYQSGNTRTQVTATTVHTVVIDAEKALKVLMKMHNIDEIRVDLWSQSKSVSGEKLGQLRQQYVVRQNDIRPIVKHL